MIKHRQLLQLGGWLIGAIRLPLIGLVLTGLLLTGCRSPEGSPFESLYVANPIALESNAFAAGASIPRRYTCDGEDLSPVVRWGAVLDKTKTLILVMDDPDAPGQAFVHWLVYNLPAAIRELPENLPKQSALDIGGVQAKNDFGKYGYGGPCPPSGTHRYIFRLFALDVALNLQPDVSKREIIKAMQGHVLASGELIGLYSR
jgi:Raf kinase inhibitor-like YbhB/YbcL family protein